MQSEGVDFLAHDGELAGLIRSRDWSDTLGPIEAWPGSLKTAAALLIHSSLPIVMLWGEDGVMIYNDAYAVFAGGRHPELLGCKVREGWPEVADFNDNVMKVGLAGGTLAYKDQELILHRHGRPEQVWMNLDYSPVIDESAKPAGVIAIVVETTERVLSERRQAGATARQRMQFEQAPGFIIIMDGADHRVEFVNASHRAAFGSADWVGKTIREAFPSVAGQGFFEQLDRVYATGEVFHAHGAEVRYRRSPGGPEEVRHLNFVYAPIFDENGAITGVFSDGFDVTEAQRAQSALRESEENYRYAAELNPQVAWTAAPDGQLDRVAERWREWTGSSGLGATWGDSIHPDDLQRSVDVWTHSVVTGDPYDIEHRVRTLAGDYRWIHSRAYPRRNADGQIVRWYGSTEDIHERKRAEDQARLAEARFRETLEHEIARRTAELEVKQAQLSAVFATTHLYQGLLTPEGVLLETNQASLDGIQGRLEDVVGRRFWDTPWFAGTPEVTEVIRQAIGRAAKGMTQVATIPLELPFGRRMFEMTLRPVRNKAGDVVAIVPEAIDITARLQAEEALRQSQKMEAMGQLTGGVAHDFNNLLTPIIGSLDLLQRRGLGDEREQRLIDGAMQSADRAKTLVQRLLAFARRQPLQPLQPQAVDMAALVTGMGDLVASTTGPHIRVVVEADEDMPPARADPNQLEMAILNLSVNARDAMPDGGVLRICAVAETLEDTALGIEAGPYVRLSVIDTGVGMDEETLGRAVEPFFSTKGIGKGTGLGLSMVHGLASQLGGALAVSSQPGAGARVDLWLPVTVWSQDDVSPPAETAEISTAGVVLLVDDEALVRATTADMLSDLGFVVVEAASGAEALRQLEEGLAPNLLVTDHLMPGMTGCDLAHRVMRMRPGTPVLIVSGYADAGDLASDLPLLAKPFRQEDLARSITDLVAPA